MTEGPYKCNNQPDKNATITDPVYDWQVQNTDVVLFPRGEIEWAEGAYPNPDD
jgi:hypothetical protein